MYKNFTVHSKAVQTMDIILQESLAGGLRTESLVFLALVLADWRVGVRRAVPRPLAATPHGQLERASGELERKA